MIYDRYVDRLADNLAHQLTLSRRSTLQITALTSKREEAIEMITNVEPQLNTLIRETKQLQKQVSLCIHHVSSSPLMPRPHAGS